eukprot:19934-Eustigmatos_ZCMA.PRE.1
MSVLHNVLEGSPTRELTLVFLSHRFYEHYDGTRNKEKCFLVGVAKKGLRRSNKAVEAAQNYRKASKAAF